MAIILNSESEALKFFETEMKGEKDASYVLYHNQRKTVLEVLKKASAKTGRKMLEKDISDLPEDQVITKRMEDNLPGWLSEIYKKCEKCAYTIYLREFSHAPKKVQNEVMNLILKREIEGEPIPENTVIILGVQDEDDVTASLARKISVKFYRQP